MLTSMIQFMWNKNTPNENIWSTPGFYKNLKFAKGNNSLQHSGSGFQIIWPRSLEVILDHGCSLELYSCFKTTVTQVVFAR